MYDVPALEMYINYDKTTHNPIEKSVGTGQQSHIIYTVTFCDTSHSTHAANTNYCTTDKSMESILKKATLIHVNVFTNNM